MKKTELSNTQKINPATSIYEIEVKDIAGNSTTLEKYKGKKILLVNLASACGYTPQYKELQAFYEANKAHWVVLGFPCNDYGAQEQGSEHEIQQFCEVNFGVTFPMFSKVNIKSSPIHPIYDWLTNPALNGWNSQVPDWNFCKFVIDEQGRLEGFYSSAVNPTELQK